MKIKFDFGKDIEKMMNKLSKVDRDAGKKAADIMKVLVDKVMAEAIKRVPVDEGFLEKSFKTKVIKALSMDEVTGVVYVPTNAPAGDYALFMHEWDYNLGPKSREKDEAQDETVGRKYLERALTENERALGLYIYKKLKEFLS